MAVPRVAGAAQAAVDVCHRAGPLHAVPAQQRLATFLQVGLLLPAQDESLSMRVTRSALAKLDFDPALRLN
jgi:hypothetical protein